MANKKPSQKNLDDAKKVAKKLAPSRSEAKRIYRRSGMSKAMPYISMLFALVLAICFIIVRIAGIEDGAGIVGYYIQYFFCGLLGFSAVLLPLLFGYLGVLWCIYQVSWTAAEAKIEGCDVVLTAPGIDAPAAVRFAGYNGSLPNLVNGAGLPAGPLRREIAAPAKGAAK